MEHLESKSIIASLAAIVGATALLLPPAQAAPQVKNRLQPATYGADCRDRDAAQSPKIGQAMFPPSGGLMLIYDIHIAALRSAPRNPEAYVLSSKSGARYLFVSRNGTAFKLYGNSYTFLGGPDLPERTVIARMMSHLRTAKNASIILTPCFSGAWNGVYPQKSPAP